MSSKKQGIVYSLLVSVVILALGLLAILGVSRSRTGRYETEINAIQRDLSTKDQQVQQLQKQLDDCEQVPAPTKPESEVNPIATDTSWSGWGSDTVRR